MKLSTRDIEVGGAGLEIVGISADLDVSVGYDNGMRLWPGDDVYADLENEWFDEEPPLSVAERIEVCNIMVKRWLALKTTLESKVDGGLL